MFSDGSVKNAMNFHFIFSSILCWDAFQRISFGNVCLTCLRVVVCEVNIVNQWLGS
jgi:hypothetical protein